jgi:hypothetical protein
MWSENENVYRTGDDELEELYGFRKSRALRFHGLCRLGKIDQAVGITPGA